MDIGNAIREIRQQRGMSQAEVAEGASLSRVGYRNIETGASSPKMETIAQIARALGVRVEEILVPRPRLHHVRFRARRALKRRGQILADVGRELRDYRELERIAGDTLSESQLVALVASFGGHQVGEARAREAARVAREACGLREDEAIRDLPGLLEDNGVVLLVVKLASEFSGLSVGREDGGPAVVVNAVLSVERQRHTSAHELGHLLLHADAFDVDRDEEVKEEEREADTFASHFLMPEEVFHREWEQARGLPLVDRVFKLKHVFGVSWQSVLVRAYPGQGEIWKRFFALYRRRFRVALSKATEPEPLPRGDFRIDRKDRLLRRALEEQLISDSRAAEILATSIKSVRDLRAAWG